MSNEHLRWLKQSGAVKLPVLALTWLLGLGLWLIYGDSADAFVEQPAEIAWWQPVVEPPALDDPIALGDALAQTLRHHRLELTPSELSGSDVVVDPVVVSKPVPDAVEPPVRSAVASPADQPPAAVAADAPVPAVAKPEPAPQSPVAIDRLEQARQLLAEQRHDAAFELLNAASTVEVGAYSPAEALLFLERYSVAALGSGRYQHSLMTYRELTRRQPDEQKWWLGVAASQQAQGQDASDALARAPDLLPRASDPGAVPEAADPPPSNLASTQPMTGASLG